MINQKNIFTNIIIALLAIIAICLLGSIGKYAVDNNLISFPTINLFHKNTKPLNKDTLYLSPPITVLYSAKITGKSTNSLSVNAYPVEPPESYETKTFAYTIKLTDSTLITKPTVFIPYALKKISGDDPTPSTISLDDLSIGDFVDITLTSDLRTTNVSELEAESILVISESNFLSGSITEINGDSITVFGIVRPTHFAPTPEVNIIDPDEETYSVTINPDTELVTGELEELHAITSSDLKIGDFLTIYANSPISGNSLSAAMISVYSQ